MPLKRYSPLKGEGGNWTLSLDTKKVSDLSVAETIDCLIVKMRNSNGLDLASFDQVQCLMLELNDGYHRAIAANPKKPDPLRDIQALVIRALFSHLGVQFQKHGGLYEVSKTLPALRRMRMLQGLPDMTDQQMLEEGLDSVKWE